MTRVITCAVIATMLTCVTARAQLTKTVPGDTKTVTATVETIERSSREVTIKKQDGTHDVLYVPAAVKRFDTLKVGDKITARYYENMVVSLKPEGQKDVDTSNSALTRSETSTAGTKAEQTTMTATITAIDPKAPSITFTGPRGWVYTSRVKDKDALAKVKVGDKVDITITKALVVSVADQ
jgi:hypothetical protein